MRRHAPEAMRRGNAHPKSKLTEALVLEIRERYAAGESQNELARQYGVTQPNIGAIVRGRAWRHVPAPQAPYTTHPGPAAPTPVRPNERTTT